MKLRKKRLPMKAAEVKKDMIGHSRDPFFEKKLQAAKRRFDKITLPENLIRK